MRRSHRRNAKTAAGGDANPTPSYGYHSEISPQQESLKWVQVDLGSSVALQQVVLRPAFDSFNGIGAGFGFPVRWRFEASDDPDFQTGTARLVANESVDFANPGTQPVACDARQCTARYIRLTASKLAPRQNDFIFALAELEAMDAAGVNRAHGVPVTAFDSIEAPPRWSGTNLVDGQQPRVADRAKLQDLRLQREQLRHSILTDAERRELDEVMQQQSAVEAELGRLPQPSLVYAGTVHQGTGAFAGTGAQGGKPRPIFLLTRGDVAKPGPEVGPGTLATFDGLPNRFSYPRTQGRIAPCRAGRLAHGT